MTFIIMCCAPRSPGPLLRKLQEQGSGPVIMVWDEPRKGAFYNAIRAFEVAAEQKGPVTILQDDAMVCDNFVSYVVRMFPQVGGIINWYVRGDEGKNGGPEFNFEHRTADGFSCTQAMTYSHMFAVDILMFMQLVAAVGTTVGEDGLGHGDDNVIRDWMQLRGVGYTLHFPSLVQHGDQPSLTGNDAAEDGWTLNSKLTRKSACYVGDDFDAMTLLRKDHT